VTETVQHIDEPAPDSALDVALAPEFRSAPKTCASSARCPCGQLLSPTPSTDPTRPGRPRVTCSQLCRRRRDSAIRKLRRRQAWLELWRSLRGDPAYSDRQIRREMAALREDMRELLAQAGPVPGFEVAARRPLSGTTTRSKSEQVSTLPSAPAPDAFAELLSADARHP
jgi:hypothetical protein